MNSRDLWRRWADRTGEYSPAYYAHLGLDERSESVRRVLEKYLGRDARVLELGCGCGRHLAHLRDAGFENLAGVELNEDAFEVMAETYPGLAAEGTFYADAIERVVGEFADGQFDAVYSVETLQHLHPDAEWVFAELGRVTDDLLVTVENEGPGGREAKSDRARADSAGRGDPAGDEREGTDDADETEAGKHSTETGVNYVAEGIPLYYRNWERVFTDLGLVAVEHVDGDRDTVRAFRTT